MAEKDVDEQFAAIMAHWNDEALGLDPSGDPLTDEDQSGTTGEPAWLDLSETTRIRDAPERPVFEPDHPVEAVQNQPETMHDDRVQEPGSDSVAVEDWSHAEAEWASSDAIDHYVPPPPAPLPPSDDKHFWTMIVALVAGPLLFLYLLLFNRDGNGWWMMFALLVSIVGFVLLVLRQPLDRDEDDDGIRL
jgi:hypothetical protein